MPMRSCRLKVGCPARIPANGEAEFCSCGPKSRAAIVLFYAQPLSRVRLTVDDVIHEGGQVFLWLGEPPCPVPGPVAGAPTAPAALAVQDRGHGRRYIRSTRKVYRRYMRSTWLPTPARPP
jgi:hypothetical protein